MTNPTQPTPSISVVIPSWNSEQQLKLNLPSVIKAAKKVNAEIIIVDDASTQDQTRAYLRSLGSKIKYLQNDHNLGFVQTVNRGIAATQTDLVVLLNTDVAPDPACFLNARSYFEDDSLFALTFNSGQGRAGGYWTQGLLHHFPLNDRATKPAPSLWASGGQAMFDRHKWVNLGGLDPLYAPFYWEDVDLGYRAWAAGYQILWVPDCRCVHDHQLSVIKNSFTRRYINRIALRNQLLFVWKNIADTSLLFSHLVSLPRLLLLYPAAVLTALLKLPRALRQRQGAGRLRTRSDQTILKHWSHS